MKHYCTTSAANSILENNGYTHVSKFNALTHGILYMITSMDICSIFFFEQLYRRGSPYGVDFILITKRKELYSPKKDKDQYLQY
jgi:hypothetical protein